ncbi:hypothetical protein RQP46_001140 [Phenoliferia psychrophenolica]
MQNSPIGDRDRIHAVLNSSALSAEGPSIAGFESVWTCEGPDDTKAVTFLYRLALGASPKSYGPHVARMAGLPDSLVERAINISKEFEGSSRARERAMRVSETVPLTAQADAAFVWKLAKLGIGKNVDPGQLLRTLKIIRTSTLKAASMKAATAA